MLSLHLRGRLLTNSSYGAGVLLRGVTRFYNMQTGNLFLNKLQKCCSWATLKTCIPCVEISFQSCCAHARHCRPLAEID